MTQELFVQLARRLGATPVNEQGPFALTLEGRRLELSLERPSKSPAVLIFRTPVGPVDMPPQMKATASPSSSPYRGDAHPTSPCPHSFEVRPERKNDRRGKQWGINREFQTGDARFDEAVYIECDAPDEILQEFFREAPVREAMLRCLGAGCESIAIDSEGSLVLRVTLAPQKPFPAAEQVRALLAELGRIADGMPALRGTLQVRYPGFWIPLVSLLWGLLALFVLLFARWRWGTILDGATRMGISAGLGLWLLALLPTIWRLRGKSTSLRDLVITLIFNLWGFPALAVVVLLAINGAFLGGPLRSREMVIEKSWVLKGKSTSYHLRLVSPDRTVEPMEFSIPYSFYLNASRARPLTLNYRTGRLGWEIKESLVSGATTDR